MQVDIFEEVFAIKLKCSLYGRGSEEKDYPVDLNVELQIYKNR